MTWADWDEDERVVRGIWCRSFRDAGSEAVVGSSGHLLRFLLLLGTLGSGSCVRYGWVSAVVQGVRRYCVVLPYSSGAAWRLRRIDCSLCRLGERGG